MVLFTDFTEELSCFGENFAHQYRPAVSFQHSEFPLGRHAHTQQQEWSRIMRVFSPNHAFLSVGFTTLQRKTSNDSLIQRVDKNEHEFKNGGF